MKKKNVKKPKKTIKKIRPKRIFKKPKKIIKKPLPKKVVKKPEIKKVEAEKVEIKKHESPKEVVKKIIQEEVKTGRIEIETEIKEMMTKDVKVLTPDDNIRKAIEMLAEFEITGVPVVSKNKIVGILSESDVFDFMKQKGIVDPKKDQINLDELEKTKVKKIMAQKPITIKQFEKITDASDLMAKHDINRLPVVDEKNHLVGIITRDDLMKALSSEFFIKSVESMKGKSIRTRIDEILDVLDRVDKISIKQLSKAMDIDKRQIEEWAKILEAKGLIEIDYPALRSPKLRKKK